VKEGAVGKLGEGVVLSQIRVERRLAPEPRLTDTVIANSVR
jgi:hypothetical protein